MMTYTELEQLRVGDYIELKKKPEECVGRIVSVYIDPYSINNSHVMFIVVCPVLQFNYPVTWTFEYLRTYMERKIEVPIEKRLIKLLYD